MDPFDLLFKASSSEGVFTVVDNDSFASSVLVVLVMVTVGIVGISSILTGALGGF